MKRKLVSVGVALLMLTLLSTVVGALPYVDTKPVTASGTQETRSTDLPGLVDTETIIQELKKLGFSKTEIAEVVNALALKTSEVPKDFVNPVTLIVRKLQGLGMRDSEIIEALKPLGMGWDPKTGGTWRGRLLTPEEQRELPERTAKVPESDASISSFEREAGMRTLYMWYGIKDEMKPGSLAIQADQTTDHCATSHLTDWTNGVDAGVFRYLANPNWQFFTWDDDGGGYAFHGTTDADTYSEYIIACRISEPGYDVWINGVYVRGDPTPSYGYVYLIKEAWSDSGAFTDDAKAAWFQRPRLYDSDGSVYPWNEYVDDDTYQDPPMYMTRQIETWPDGDMWTELIWVANP